MNRNSRNPYAPGAASDLNAPYNQGPEPTDFITVGDIDDALMEPAFLADHAENISQLVWALHDSIELIEALERAGGVSEGLPPHWNGPIASRAAKQWTRLRNAAKTAIRTIEEAENIAAGVAA